MALESGKAISQDILEELNYSDTEEAAREIILLKGRSKIAEYSEKVEKYEKKYDMNFEQFQTRVEHQKETENFEEEEDLMAWQFVRDALKHWEKHITELEDAA
jgi:hypothetical protein